MYYLNSHNHKKKKTFFSCNYGIILSECLENFIQIISTDNSNKFINIIPNSNIRILFIRFCETNVKRIFFFFNGKEASEVSQCKVANYDLIHTVLFLFALIFFKDPQQYNHPPIYGDHVSTV